MVDDCGYYITILSLHTRTRKEHPPNSRSYPSTTHMASCTRKSVA